MNLAIICPGPSVTSNITLLRKIKEKIPTLKVVVLNEIKLIDLLIENNIGYDYYTCFTKETLNYHQNFLSNINNLITTSQALLNIKISNLNNVFLCDNYIKKIYEEQFRKNYNFSNFNGEINSLMALLYSLENLNQNLKLNIYLFGVDGVTSKNDMHYFIDISKTIYKHDIYHSNMNLYNTYYKDQVNFEKIYKKKQFKKLNIYNCNPNSAYNFFQEFNLELLNNFQNISFDLKFLSKVDLIQSVNQSKFEQFFADFAYNMVNKNLDDFTIQLIRIFFNGNELPDKVKYFKKSSIKELKEFIFDTNISFYEKYSLIFALTKVDNIFLKLAF